MRAPSTRLVLACLLGMTLQSAAQRQPATAPDAGTCTSSGNDVAAYAFQQRSPHYRLHKSDVIAVQFTFSPEFNQTVTVQPDGYISLKGAGEIEAENKTVAELVRAIEIAYRGILHDPAITISLKDFDKPFFLASGQVGKPGKYELRSDTTLTEALAIAGGFTEAAKHSQVVLFRRISTESVEARVFNVKHMLNSRNLQEDPHLLPGDMLYVPQSKWSKVRRYLPTSSMGVYASPTSF
jgi:protein involved in polysaccharide export with SLBB domain